MFLKLFFIVFTVVFPALLIFLSNKKKKYQTGEREIFYEKNIKCHCKPVEMCVATHKHVALRVSLDFSADALGEAQCKSQKEIQIQ